MTRVYAKKGGGKYLLRCDGHAKTSAACNYITGIMYAFAGYVKNAERWGNAKINALEIEAEAPRFVVDCIGGSDVEAAFDAAVIGFLQLQETDAEEVTVEMGKFSEKNSETVVRNAE